VSASSGQWAVPPVSAIWIPPDVEHEFVSLGAFDGWSIYVPAAACAPLPSEPFVLRLSDLLTAAVRRAGTWDDDTDSSRKTNISNVILDELATAPEDRLALPMPRDGRLAKIAKAVAGDPARKLSFSQRAEDAGIPSRTLSRKFVKETGLTFKAWRQRALLLRSLELLADGNSVTTVAFDLGYETVSAFIDLFRNHFGTTPSRYFGRCS
jgi:AraC-like DNA-binding protein